MGKIISVAIIYFLVAYFVSWYPFKKYELHKYYKDPLSLAAILMGGTYAGVVDEFNTLDKIIRVRELFILHFYIKNNNL